MPRGSGRRSEASDIELDGIAEQELIRLQQEYRIMEGDRKAYSEESQYVIRKQREAIAVLQAENEELMKENRLAGSQQNQTNDSKNIDSLSDMLTEESNIRKQVKNMKEAIAKLDQDIYQTEKKISHQRKKYWRCSYEFIKTCGITETSACVGKSIRPGQQKIQSRIS